MGNYRQYDDYGQQIKRVKITTSLITDSTSTVQFNLASSATGDLYYRDATGNLARLGIGTNGQVLAVNGSGLPAWAAASGGSGSYSTTYVTGDYTVGATETYLVLLVNAPNITFPNPATYPNRAITIYHNAFYGSIGGTGCTFVGTYRPVYDNANTLMANQSTYTTATYISDGTYWRKSASSYYSFGRSLTSGGVDLVNGSSTISFGPAGTISWGIRGLKAGTGISLTSDNNDITITASGGTTYTFSNGLTNTAGAVTLGGSLTGNTQITNSTYQFMITATGSNAVLSLQNTGTGNGIASSASSGVAVSATSSSNNAVYAISTSASAVYAGTNGTQPIFVGYRNDVSTTGSVSLMELRRLSQSTPADGIAGHINIYMSHQGGSADALILQTSWTDSLLASRTSDFSMLLFGSATQQVVMNMKGSGQLKLNKYGVNTFAGTAAYILGVDASGNIVETTAGGADTNFATTNLTLTGARTHNFGAYNMQFNGSGSGSVLDITNSSTGRAVAFTSNSGQVAYFSANTANAGSTFFNSGTGEVISLSAIGGVTNGYNNVMSLTASPSGTAANGIGARIYFYIKDSSGSNTNPGSLSYKWTDVTTSTRTSQFEIWGVNNGLSPAQLLTVKGPGQLQLNKYGVNTFAGTAAYALGVDASGNVVEIATGGGTTYTFSNGLTNTSGTVGLGGSLTSTTTITGGSFQLNITGTGNAPLNVTTTTGAGVNCAIAANGGSGIGISANSNTSSAVSASTTSGVAVSGNAASGVAGSFSVNPASTNSIIEVINLQRTTTGTAAAGLGGSLAYYLEIDNGSLFNSTNLVSKWTDAANATKTSQFYITGLNSAVSSTLLTLNGTGQLQLNKYGVNTFGAYVASYALGVDSSGNVVEITTPAKVGYTSYVAEGTTPTVKDSWTPQDGGTVWVNIKINSSDGNHHTFVKEMTVVAQRFGTTTSILANQTIIPKTIGGTDYSGCDVTFTTSGTALQLVITGNGFSLSWQTIQTVYYQ